MAKIEHINDKRGVPVYPVTVERAVIDSEGVTLDVKLANISGGMTVVELLTSSGILTEEQLNLVQSDHCIVKYNGYYYYKNSSGDASCTYNRVSEEKGERSTTDYYFTCTYSSGVFTFGSTVTPQGSPDAVKYVEQELTSEQKAQARSNIGAGTYSKPAGGIPASDMASGAIPEQIQSDWNQTDNTAKDYIKNKPNIPSAVSDVVKYTPQTLSSAQQEQARTNIGAGTSSFSGNYNDLSNKPTIPTVPAISTDISADATSDTKTASPKAVKDYVDEHGGSDSEAVKFVAQTLDSTQKAQARTNIGAQETLVSGVNIVTINSQSILTGGDITVSDGDPGIGIQDVTTPAQYDGTLIITLTDGSTITVDLNHSHPQYYDKIVGTSIPQGGMLPDVVYKLGTLTGNVTFSLASPITGNTNHYFWTFTTGTPAPTITWPANITWAGGYGPALSESKYYEISIMDGIAAYMEV